ncbi:MAG: tetrahydromethanopterin S-methyltransferase subunit B [Methanosarcinales archaeon]
MSIIRAAPEFHLVIDPMTGVVAKERSDVIMFSMDPIMEQLDELDKIADDLMNSLTPTSPLLSSFPGREKTSYLAGIYTNAFYGIIVGLIISFLALLIIGGIGGGT